MRPEDREVFVEWCRRERDDNKKLVYLLSSGTMQTRRNDGSGWQDTTQEALERSNRIISDMEDLIKRIEANDA